MKKKKNFQESWSSNNPKELTEYYINHIYTFYQKEYNKESLKFERKNNFIFLSVALISLLITLLVGLQDYFPKIQLELKIVTFILPLISSFLLLYTNQKGYKRKEELREYARIYSKYLVDSARIEFAVAKTDSDFLKLYLWLNEEIKRLQLNQATEYFTIHNDKKIDAK